MAIQRSGRFERIKTIKSDMNVVPYIDVMLVLLVIFMVTAPMITSGIKVDLPQANNHQLNQKICQPWSRLVKMAIFIFNMKITKIMSHFLLKNLSLF